MRGIAKRSRYADVYNAAYERRADLHDFVSGLLREFALHPAHHVRLPHHVKTMLATQTIGRDAHTAVVASQSLALSDFVERRAARCISRWALRHLYKPGGWFVTQRLCVWKEGGVAAKKKGPL